MDLLPLETLAVVATLLPHADLCRFRFVNRRCAAISYPIISRQLSLLDTSWCIRKFADFIGEHGSLLQFTRTITIYCGDWPRCPRPEWETHPLLRPELHPTHLLRRTVEQKKFTKAINWSYEKYIDFVNEEENRHPYTDKQTLQFLLLCMPNIQALRFRPYRTSYRSLSQNSMYGSFVDDIGIRPTFRGLSAKTIETYALLLPKLEALTELCLDGRLALDQVSLTTIKTIRSLKLVSVGKLDGFTEFMAAFPCLVQFSFESRSTVLLPLDRTIWPELRFLRLIGVWVTKEAISHVIATTESHKVTWEFEAVTLANSTWGSFWAAMHQDGHQITFTNNNEVVTYK